MSKSKIWLQEHFSDQYVKQAQELGYPSRAAFKLLEMQEKDKFIKPGMTIVDLGAAPGGWSVVAKEIVGPKGRVFALDRLEMDPIAGVTFLRGDFTEQEVLDSLLEAIGDVPVDLVMSDMAPNISGQKSIDQPRAMYLVELAWDLAKEILRPRGAFLVKIFQGEGFETLLKELRGSFEDVKIRKPKSSRARSSELYILGTGFLGYNQ